MPVCAAGGHPGIRNHRKSWLWEACLGQVGEGSMNEAASHRSGSGGSNKLQHGSLANIFGGNDTDISRVFKGGSCQQKRLPGSVQMCDSGAITVYCPIWKPRWVPPTWAPAARNVMTSSFAGHQGLCTR